MAFKELPGGKGKIWIPEELKEKKHNCTDCFACQFCSDSRCELCLKKKNKKN